MSQASDRKSSSSLQSRPAVRRGRPAAGKWMLEDERLRRSRLAEAKELNRGGMQYRDADELHVCATGIIGAAGASSQDEIEKAEQGVEWHCVAVPSSWRSDCLGLLPASSGRYVEPEWDSSLASRSHRAQRESDPESRAKELIRIGCKAGRCKTWLGGRKRRCGWRGEIAAMSPSRRRGRAYWL